MSGPFIDPPVPEMTISVTLGADAQFTYARTDGNGDPVDFTAATLAIDLDWCDPVTITGTVTANQATFVIPHATARSVPRRNTLADVRHP